MDGFKVLPAGDTALVIELGDLIDRRINARVLTLAHRLREAQIEGVDEIVPTFRSLMIHFDPSVQSVATLTAQVEHMMRESPPVEQPARLWRVPVCYDPCFGLDLEDVAAKLGLTPAQLVERHSAGTYHIYMLGFLPGQAYMGDLPPELALPRREIPRQKIPAGSVAIAMSMTCIFPMETPCGWHLIGHSPVSLFHPAPAPRVLFAPGDQVTFAPLSRREHDDLIAAGDRGMPWLDPDLARSAA